MKLAGFLTGLGAAASRDGSCRWAAVSVASAFAFLSAGCGPCAGKAGEELSACEAAGDDSRPGGSLPVPAGCTPTVRKGDVQATSNADVDELSGVTHVEGTLIVRSGVSDVASLSCLTYVGGMKVEGSELESLDLAGLREIGADLSVASNPRLVSLMLPQLESISGPTNLATNIALEEVSLPALTSVGALNDTSLNFADLAMLREIEVPSLPEMASGLRVSDVGRLQVEEPLQIDFSALTKVGGSLTLANNPRLTSLGGFPALVEVGGFVVQGNSALLTCLATDLAEQLGATPQAISGNGADECGG